MTTLTQDVTTTALSGAPASGSAPHDIMLMKIDADNLNLDQLKSYINLVSVLLENHDLDYKEDLDDIKFREWVSISDKDFFMVCEKFAKNSSVSKKIAAAKRYRAKRTRILAKLKVARSNAINKKIGQTLAHRKRTRTNRDVVQYAGAQFKVEEHQSFQAYLEARKDNYIPGEFIKKLSLSETLLNEDEN